jgi:hypothetical protein
MKTQKQFKAAAIGVMAIGIIHISATPLILTPFKILPGSEYLTFVYMFVVTGLAVILNGLIQYLIARQPVIGKPDFMLLKMNVWFMVLISLGAVITMWHNFNPFAYMMLLLSCYELILLRNLKNQLNEQD